MNCRNIVKVKRYINVVKKEIRILAAIEYLSERVESADNGNLVTERNLEEITDEYEAAKLTACSILSPVGLKLWLLFMDYYPTIITSEVAFYKQIGLTANDYASAKQELIKHDYLYPLGTTSKGLMFCLSPGDQRLVRKVLFV